MRLVVGFSPIRASSCAQTSTLALRTTLLMSSMSGWIALEGIRGSQRRARLCPLQRIVHPLQVAPAESQGRVLTRSFCDPGAHLRTCPQAAVGCLAREGILEGFDVVVVELQFGPRFPCRDPRGR
jgi:hypothetical protein